MSEYTANSFLPEKARFFSGSSLKVLAMLIMLIDHSASHLLRHYPPAMEPLFTFNGIGYSLYRILRDVGRIAFPIFCFLLVEGFLNTRDRRKYGLNLFIFACISEIPWNLIQNSTIWYREKQNVFFTLFLGYLAFCAIEHFKENQFMQLVCMAALFAAAWNMKADYGWKGYTFLLVMYWLHDHSAAQMMVGGAVLSYEWKASFAFLPINMYNGKRGFIRGKCMKYFFYAFYPLHITIIVILRKLIFSI